MMSIGRCVLILALLLLAVRATPMEGEKDVWKKEVEKLHYGHEPTTEDYREEKIRESDKRGAPDRTSRKTDSQERSSGATLRWRDQRPAWMTTLGYIVLGVVVVVLLYYIVRALDPGMRSRRIRSDTGSTVFEDNPESLTESELDRALREALERKDYRMAVRIRFLQALRHLEELKVIQWRKSKTNREYLAEARAVIPVSDLRTLILVYEQVWFGDMAGNHKTYAVVEELALKLHKTNDA